MGAAMRFVRTVASVCVIASATLALLTEECHAQGIATGASHSRLFPLLQRVQSGPQQPPHSCDDPRFSAMLLNAFNDFRPNSKIKAVGIGNLVTTTWDTAHTVFTCHVTFRFSDGSSTRGAIGIHLDQTGKTVVTWDRD